MKKLRRLLARHYLTILVAIGVIGCAVLLYGYGTRSFVPAISAAEKQTIDQSTSIQAIIDNPLWLPYKAIAYAAGKAGFADVSIRFVSGFFAIITVYAFYSIARKWYSQRVAVLTTALFAISSTTLTVSRIATPAILLYFWLVYIATVAWFKTTRRTKLAPFIVLVLSGALIYVPGSVWFFALLTLWFWKDIPKIFKHMNKTWISLGAVIAVVSIAPLVYATVRDHTLLRSWLLLPQTLSLGNTLEAAKDLPAVFFYRSNMTGAYNLGKLPLFDAFTGTMLLLGVYSYRKKLRLERTIVYILAGVVSFSLAAVNQNQLYLLFCLPFMYLLVGEGIYFILNQWRSVFPRNPIARFVGTLLVSVAVFGACSYHLNRYFLAWINAPETKQIYVLEPKA